MKRILFITLLLQSTASFAQDIKAPDFTYCQIVGRQTSSFSNKVEVSIDYGQEYSFNDNRIIDEETRKVKRFNSMIDALNDMVEKGWEFVQAYVINEGEEGIQHFLLRRRMTDEEKKKYIPLTMKDIKPKE